METICVFGDSITWGANDSKNGGWVTLLRNHMEEKDVAVYNCGVSGDTTDDLLVRFKTEANAREPDMIIFAIGANDSQYNGDSGESQVSKEQFKKNLTTLVKQAREHTNKIVFVGLLHVDESKVTPIPWSDKNKNYDNTHIDAYNSLVEDVCREKGLRLISMNSVLQTSQLDDGLHPDSEGHKTMYENIKEGLEKELDI